MKEDSGFGRLTPSRVSDSAREPVSTVAELRLLDDAELLEGYLDGFHREPAPGDNRSKSYWHGWRNGMVDCGAHKGDAAQAALAHEVVSTGYLRELCGPKDQPQ